jgi:hypothetical protein
MPPDSWLVVAKEETQGYTRPNHLTFPFLLSPAWDFQWILPTFEVLQEYAFKVRVAYRERCGRAEVGKEYKKWREKLSRDGDKKDK